MRRGEAAARTVYPEEQDLGLKSATQEVRSVPTSRLLALTQSHQGLGHCAGDWRAGSPLIRSILGNPVATLESLATLGQ